VKNERPVIIFVERAIICSCQAPPTQKVEFFEATYVHLNEQRKLSSNCELRNLHTYKCIIGSNTQFGNPLMILHFLLGRQFKG
jgi:hypothetical protein